MSLINDANWLLTSIFAEVVFCWDLLVKFQSVREMFTNSGHPDVFAAVRCGPTLKIIYQPAARGILTSQDFQSSAETTPVFVAMLSSGRYAVQCCARRVRSSRPAYLFVYQQTSRRCNSTEAALNPKIAGIVDQISQLTLLETADLVTSLKVCAINYSSTRSVAKWGTCYRPG
jgi:hypothetical protein